MQRSTKVDPPATQISPEPDTHSGHALGSRGDYAALWAHHDVGELVLATKDFIVHVTKAGQLDWETTAQYDAEVKLRDGYAEAAHNAVLNEAASLEVIPCEGIGDKNWRHFKRLIGEALACSLEQDYTAAKRMLLVARQYVEARSEETSRDWYLTASSVATLPFALVGVVLWIFRDAVISVVGSSALWISLCAAAGALGALFSVIARTGKLKFDCSAGRRLHNLEGSSRIVAGAISGLLVALAVQSELIFASLSRGGRVHAVMVMAALAAGTGERLATSIISRMDATNANNRQHSNEDVR